MSVFLSPCKIQLSRQTDRNTGMYPHLFRQADSRCKQTDRETESYINIYSETEVYMRRENNNTQIHTIAHESTKEQVLCGQPTTGQHVDQVPREQGFKCP